MEANDEKINAILQFAQKLCDDGHPASDRIAKKGENIRDRRDAIRDRAYQQMEVLKDQLQLHQFLQDCEQVCDQ